MGDAEVNGPKVGFVGEEVEFVAAYEPSTEVERIVLEVLTQEGHVVEIDQVELTRSPARWRWTVRVPAGTSLPTKLKYRARIKSTTAEKFAADFLEVHEPPRMSIWVTHGFTPLPGGQVATCDTPAGRKVIEELLAASKAPDGRQTLHDASLVATIAPTLDGIGADWDRALVPWLTASQDSKRIAHFQAMRDTCGDVKLLAGYEAASIKQNVANFMTFLNKVVAKGFKNPDPAVVDAHVGAILQRMSSVNWDGISLDIEIGSMKPEHVDAMEMFVDKLASALRPRLLAFACYGFTGPGLGKDGYPVASNVQFFKAQPYELCRGRPNVIARPMTYEGAVDRKYIEDTMKWAFDGLGLQRHQMQVGYQTDPQPHATKSPPGIQTQASVINLVAGAMREQVCGLVMWGLFSNSAAAMARFPKFEQAYRRTP